MSDDSGRRGSFWRDNSLTLAFGIAFLVVLACQAVVGQAEFNEQLTVDGMQQVGFGDYLTSSDFAVDVTENWQSEFLQFSLYIFGTVYLVQRGAGPAMSPPPTSGIGPCRTGSPNSSRSRRWSCCRSTFASAAPRSPSRSVPRTT